MRDDCFELIVISYWSFCLIQPSAVKSLTGAWGRCTKDIICITSDCNFVGFFQSWYKRQILYKSPWSISALVLFW